MSFPEQEKLFNLLIFQYWCLEQNEGWWLCESDLFQSPFLKQWGFCKVLPSYPHKKGVPGRMLSPQYPLGISRNLDKTQSLSNGVKQTPDCCRWTRLGLLQTPAALLDIHWNKPSLQSPAWQMPRIAQSIQVFLSLDLLSCTLQDCQLPSKPGTGQATPYDLSPPWSFTSCLTLQIPSGLSQLWGCGLGSRIPKSHQHQLGTAGAVCKQIATGQDKRYQVSLNAGVAQDQYHTHKSAWSFFLSYSK